MTEAPILEAATAAPAPLWLLEVLDFGCQPLMLLPLMLCCAKSVQLCPLFVTLCTGACQASLCMGYSRSRILEWVAMPSSREIFLTQGSKPQLLHCRQILYH